MRPAINAQGTIISHVPNSWSLQAQASLSMPDELSQKCCCFWPIVQPSRDTIIDEMPSFFSEKRKGICSPPPQLHLNSSHYNDALGVPRNAGRQQEWSSLPTCRCPNTLSSNTHHGQACGRASCLVPRQETTRYLLLQVLIQQST